MSHELTEEKIAELHNEHNGLFTPTWDRLHGEAKQRQIGMTRAAYDLGKQTAATHAGTGWTDAELRAAINPERSGGFTLFGAKFLRKVLDRLGIDHQPKPELPTEVGKSIYDVVDDREYSYLLMTLDSNGIWCGVNHRGVFHVRNAGEITSFGGVLDLEALRDLDKVRGEQA